VGHLKIAHLSWRLLATIVVSYIFVLVLLPMGALLSNSMAGGWGGFLEDLSQPVARKALQLTFEVALIGALVNGVFGLLTAYVLVRFEFPGKGLLNALVDLPFAIPTNVSGLMLLAVYGGGSPLGKVLEGLGLPLAYSIPGVVVAVILVTFPFTIRALQPLLEELDPDIEAAAYILGASRWKTFWKVTFPSLLPGVLSGVTLAFSRGLAEFGAVVVVAGNIPMKTQLAAVYIYGEMESYNARGATSISIVLVAAAIVLLVLLNLVSSKQRLTIPRFGLLRKIFVKGEVKEHGNPVIPVQDR